MAKPTTKQELKEDIYSFLGFHNLSSFVKFPVALVLEMTRELESKILKYLTDKMEIQKPVLPSNRWKKWTVSEYVDEIWDLNKSYFEIILPNDNDPQNRERFMGHTIVHHKELVKKLEEIETSDEWNNGWFAKLPYHERKYLSLTRDFEDYEKNTPDIKKFRISHVPSGIVFEDCIPTIGELYIAHPYKLGVYLPVSRYEHLLFRDRIHELSKVMMALGAIEIRSIQNDGMKSFSKDSASSSLSGGVGVGHWVSASGSSRFESEHSINNDREEEIVINFKNDPMKLPYLPNDLIWFNHESEWQQVAEARLNGNMLEYEIRISSKQINLISERERSNIEAQAKMLFASGSISKESSSFSIFREERTKSTSLLIRFKSRKEYDL